MKEHGETDLSTCKVCGGSLKDAIDVMRIAYQRRDSTLINTLRVFPDKPTFLESVSISQRSQISIRNASNRWVVG
jgi:hypothetical protein